MKWKGYLVLSFLNKNNVNNNKNTINKFNNNNNNTGWLTANTSSIFQSYALKCVWRVHIAHTKKDCVMYTQQARLRLVYDWPWDWLADTLSIP